MRVHTFFAAAAIVAVAAGCQTAPDEAAMEREAMLERTIAARQGAEVSSVCFMNSINGWKPLGDRALLLRQGVNDWFKVDLTGTCRPDEAFAAASIAVSGGPGGSSCLRPGDRIATREPGIGGTSCGVQRIYEWDDDAPVPDATDASLGMDGGHTGGG